MDIKETSEEVSLPSATHSEPRTTLEKQNLITIAKVAGGSRDKKSVDTKEDEEVESESDNEEIGASGAGAVKKDDVNLDDEFEKIVPFKFKKLSEESLDEVDHEIEEILHEAEPLGQEIKTDIDPHAAEPSPSPDDSVQTFEPVEVKQEASIVEEKSQPEVVKQEKLSKDQEKPIEDHKELIEKPKESIDDHKSSNSDQQKSSSDVQERTPPSDSIESKHIEASINDSEPKATLIAAETVPSAKRENSADEKPPVPAPTYLWEDLKRAKEQGGYPWTHLTKEPLGPDDDPQSILSYKQSPRASRKASNESHGTPKSQKKVRIQDEIEIQETQNYIQDLSDDEDEDATEVGSADDNLDSDEAEEIKEEVAADSKAPSKGILKRSQQILENIKPTTSKFDSGSLKKKIKNPLSKIKKMADQQFKKVKSSRPFIKKIPISKDEIVLNDDLKILKLKESPKSQHRDIASYVVKHQDSADSVEIVELERSPNETRKRRDVEDHVVTPDEVIELPSPVNSEESDQTVESHEISMSGSSQHSVKEEKPAAPIKRGHHYEDIDDYISRMTSDGEDVERVKFEVDPKLKRQDQVGFDDPIFDEFSREMNKSIRRSLSIQDDKMRHELAKKIPKIKELEQQISDEDLEEKVIEEPMKINLALPAPISSIDSTSSDEDHRRQLPVVGEDIDDYISRMTSDGEDVERVKFEVDPKLKREDQVGFDDPIFDEFSREMNKSIRRSLSIQDDKMRHELAKKIPKIKELEQQISDEDREEKIIEEPMKINLALLAPISSIDSTSSDEDHRRQLSVVGEESETSGSLKAKCSFEESVDRDIESLKNDGSDISTTLMEDQIENVANKLEATIVEEVSKILPEKKPEVPAESEKQNDVESEVRAAAQEAIAKAFQEALDKVANDELSKDEQAVKEDVVVKIAAETAAPIKVSERWSKMRTAFKGPKLLKKQSKVRKFFKQCLPFWR